MSDLSSLIESVRSLREEVEKIDSPALRDACDKLEAVYRGLLSIERLLFGSKPRFVVEVVGNKEYLVASSPDAPVRCTATVRSDAPLERAYEALRSACSTGLTLVMAEALKMVKEAVSSVYNEMRRASELRERVEHLEDSCGG